MAAGDAMRADLAEQPGVVARALEQGASVGRELRRPRAVLLFGRGSSEHAALYGKYLLETVAGLPAAIGAPSVATLYAAALDLDGWLAVGVSQSGATREICACLEWAAARGATTLALTNDDGSPLASAADATLAVGAGPERAVAATKTFTGECSALAALAYAWSGTPLPPAEVGARIEAALARPLDDALVDALAGAALCLALGRGAYVPMAAELALKLMEGCGVWSTGGSWADLLHGPITALPPGTPALVFEGGARMSESWSAARARLGESGLEPWPVAAGRPEAGDLDAIADIVVGQRLVLEAARLRGTDPDRPPGLGKVTQT